MYYIHIVLTFIKVCLTRWNPNPRKSKSF